MHRITQIVKFSASPFSDKATEKFIQKSEETSSRQTDLWINAEKLRSEFCVLSYMWAVIYNQYLKLIQLHLLRELVCTDFSSLLRTNTCNSWFTVGIWIIVLSTLPSIWFQKIFQLDSRSILKLVRKIRIHWWSTFQAWHRSWHNKHIFPKERERHSWTARMAKMNMFCVTVQR